MIVFVSKHISLYTFVPSQYPKKTHLNHNPLSLTLLSSGTIAYAMLPTHASVQCKVSSHSTFFHVQQSAKLSSNINLVYKPHSPPFRPKQFLELLSFKHMLCHCNNGSICTLRWSNDLRRALNAAFHPKSYKIY